MKNDPIVEEIHETRRRIWKECGEDFQVLVKRLRETEQKYKDRLVKLPLKKIRRKPPGRYHSVSIVEVDCDETEIS